LAYKAFWDLLYKNRRSLALVLPDDARDIHGHDGDSKVLASNGSHDWEQVFFTRPGRQVLAFYAEGSGESNVKI
jgi:hypothetical protein